MKSRALFLDPHSCLAKEPWGEGEYACKGSAALTLRWVSHGLHIMPAECPECHVVYDVIVPRGGWAGVRPFICQACRAGKGEAA